MSVARRFDGRWLVKYKDEQGRWKQRSFRSEAEARRFDGDCQYDEAENERLTVLEAVLVFLKNSTLCPKTVRLHRYVVQGTDRRDGTHNPGPAEHLASRYVDTLTRRDRDAVRDVCRGKRMRGSSINRMTGCLMSAFNWCVQEDLLAENPWAKYRRVREEQRPMAGTLEEFRRVYAELPPWMQWACRTCMALCLRPGLVELFGLRWNAFHWPTRSVEVFMGKVRASKRVFPPEEYLAEARARYEADGMDNSRLVCRTGRGRQVGRGAYAKAWAKALGKAGVRRMPMYAIRHIAASEMLAGGADLAAVAAQLGHRDLTTTGHYYAHALPEAQRRAAKALPACTNLVQNGAENKEDPKQ